MSTTHRSAVIPSPVLGMVIFIATEIMFFAGLVSTYLVIRAGIAFWPPIGQPRLPVEATAFNTLVLLMSGVTAWLSGRSFADGQTARMRRLFGLTVFLGVFFVLFQGYEWIQLINFGLTLSGESGVYGGLFYIIIGAHALHVIAAVCLMVYIWFRLPVLISGEGDSSVFGAARLFWYFVVAVWPVLYGLVYFY